MPSCTAKAQLDQHPKHGQLVSLNLTLYPENSPSMGAAWSRGWPLEGDDKRTLFNELVEFASRHNVDYALVKAEVERALAEAKPYVRDERFAMPAGVEEEEAPPTYPVEVIEVKVGESRRMLDQAKIAGSQIMQAADEIIAEVSAKHEPGCACEYCTYKPGEKPKEGVTLDDLDELRGKK